MPQAATTLTTQTLLHAPAMCSYAFRTSSSALLPSQRLNVSTRGTSLVDAAAVMAVEGMAEVVCAILEDA